jgi:glycosyltransferase involved in cell wall biosynthesis
VKVLILGQFPWDWQRMEGGVESTLLYLVDELAVLPDTQVQVIACHPWIATPEVRERGAVRVHYLPRQRRGRITGYREDIAAIQRIIDAERPDIVHGHGTSVYAGAALQCGRPAVITAHGIVFRELNYAMNLAGRLRGMLDASYERRCIARARYLIAIAPYVQREFGATVRGRIWNIPNAIADGFFAIEPKPTPDTILYPGVVTPRKAVDELIEALSLVHESVPDVQLRIAGETRYYPGYVARVRQIVVEKGLEANVQFLGFQSEDGILREYASASVLALASHQETLPVSVQQAMATGLPVASTAVGGVSDIMVHEKSGLLVKPGDMRALADAMLRLLQDQPLAQSLAARARQYAEANFRASVVARRVRDVYQEILDGERGKARGDG